MQEAVFELSGLEWEVGRDGKLAVQGRQSGSPDGVRPPCSL